MPWHLSMSLFCSEEATTRTTLNLKDGLSALQSLVLFWKCHHMEDLTSVQRWLGHVWSLYLAVLLTLIYAYAQGLYTPNVLCCWPHSLSLLKVCRPRFEPRAALENCYRISSCKQFLSVWNAYFWPDCCIFLHWKKSKLPDSTVEQSQPAVKCCFKGLLL